MKTRAFNTIDVLPSGLLRKTGPAQKITDELMWYDNVPDAIRMYTPQVMSETVTDDGPGECSYLMEYLPGESLAYLIVDKYMSQDFWSNICVKLEQLLMTMQSHRRSGPIEDPLFLKKTLNRCPHNLQVVEMVDWLKGYNLPEANSVLHGDLCFSNILYDDRVDTLKIIDPRGWSGMNGVQGSQLYDIAKLYHSIIGHYDFIMENKPPTARDMDNLWTMRGWLVNYTKREWGVEERVIIAMTSLLFYSMLPLHAEDPTRVTRLGARAFHFYKVWKNT